MPGKFCTFRKHPQLELPLVYALTVCVPAIVELALVLVRPFFRDVVGSVVCAWREIQEEWLIGGNLFAIRNESNRFVRKVFSEVIPLLRCFRWIHLVIVVDEVGIILMRVAA